MFRLMRPEWDLYHVGSVISQKPRQITNFVFNRATVGIISFERTVSWVIHLDAHQLGLQLCRGAYLSADDGSAHSIVDLWSVCSDLRRWLGCNIFHLSGNHGSGAGRCRSVVKGWLGCEGKHGASGGVTGLKKTTKSVIFATSVISKNAFNHSRLGPHCHKFVVDDRMSDLTLKLFGKAWPPTYQPASKTLKCDDAQKSQPSQHNLIPGSNGREGRRPM